MRRLAISTARKHACGNASRMELAFFDQKEIVCVLKAICGTATVATNIIWTLGFAL